MRKLLHILYGIVTLAAVAMLFAIIIVEWMAGCGGYYIDSNHQKVYKECVVIPFNPTDEPSDGETER